MNSLLLSKFETYLFDQELELEIQQANVEAAGEEIMKIEEYPPGFFSSL